MGLFDSPLLDLVESLEHGHGDKDDDGLLSSLDVDLLGGGDGELLQLGLELGDVGLQVEDGLGDGLLDLVGGAGGGVGGTLNLGSVGGHFVLLRVRIRVEEMVSVSVRSGSTFRQRFRVD